MARKILLADDSVTAQNMGRRILTEAGYEVITVNNGSAALKKIAEQKPDLAILDVYMPGYGGLEVCQRMKEGTETLAIPVLLTVGKLEPFRADEARRVHADAHLVKPFEASELLAALNKLEDKIVPQAEGWEGRNSSAGRRASSARGADFGDSETGWKSRLVIPATPKPEEKAVPSPEGAKTPPASVAPVTAFRNFEHPHEAIEDVRPMDAPGTAASIYNGTLQDITPEEVAAIAAAAAAFGEKSHQSRADVEEQVASPAPLAEASNRPADVEARESATEAAQAEREPIGASAAWATPERDEESLAGNAEEYAAMERVVDADVVAALNALAPQAAEPGADEDVAIPEEVSVAAGASAMNGSRSSGPRWVAEEVPLEEGEASFILEREMHKVFAALAGVEADARSGGMSVEGDASSAAPGDVSPAARAEAAPSPEEAHFPPKSLADSAANPEAAISAGAEGVHPEAENTEAPESESAPVEAVTASVESGNEPEAAPEITMPPSAPGWSKEHVRAQAETPVEAVAAEKNASEPEFAAASAETTPALTSETTNNEPTAPSTNGETEAESKPEAAYAAAATVSAGFRSINPIGASRSTETKTPPEENAGTAASAAPAQDAPEREAELAAAWAQWRQIRESIGSKPSSQAADRVADADAEFSAQLNRSHSQEPSSAPDSSAADAEPSDPKAIANIVDSMLAELRPKLVEEIAKKMGKEPK